MAFTGQLGTDDSQLGDIELGLVPSGGDSTPSGSDSGSGTDDATLAVAVSDSDSGSGADDASGGVAVSDSDSGTGSDNSSKEIDGLVTEAGTGVDSAIGGFQGQTSESGHGTDYAAIDSPGPSESAAGSDSAHVTKFGADTISACGPYSGPVQILYDGIDITACVLFGQTSFKSAANGAVGTCEIRVKDVGHAFGFVAGRSLELRINDVREWAGFVGRVKNGYFFTGSLKAPGDVERYFQLDGVDFNVLFQKRIIFDKVKPETMQLTTYPADTDDDVVIKAYLENHLDLSGDGLSTAGIEHVGTPSQDDEISGSAGWTWGQLARFLRFNTGALDYIDPDKVIIHTDVDTPDAPFSLVDSQPADSSEVSAREVEIEFGGDALRNDALVWGLGQGSVLPVFKRTEDATSIADHNRWQVANVMTSVWKQATVDRASSSLVYGSPQNKRGGKDDAVAVRLVTFQQGFRVGQKAQFTSGVWGFSDVLPIRSMEIDFPTQTDPQYRLVLSHEIDDPWASMDPFKFNFDVPPVDFNIDIPPFKLPPFNFCAGAFVDTFDNREIPRSIHYNWDEEHLPGELFHFFGPSDVIPWGITSDGFHQWHVNQSDESDRLDLGAESLLGGFGVGSGFLGNGAGFMSFDKDNVVPNFSFAQIHSNEIPAIWDGDWTFETIVHLNHHKTFSGEHDRVTLDIIAGDANVALSLSFDPGFFAGPYSQFGMQESNSLTYETNPDGLSLGYGIPWHIKWEHFPSTGVARAKIWEEGSLEPDWQLTDDVFDYRPYRPSDVGSPDFPDLIIGPDSSLRTGSDPTDYVRLDFEYIFIYSPDLAVCIDPLTVPPSDPGIGPVAEPGSPRSAPPGYPPTYSYFNTSAPFSPGSTRVWLDGLLLRRGVDYDEGDPYYGHFIIIPDTIDVTGKTVLIAYDAVVGG